MNARSSVAAPARLKTRPHFVRAAGGRKIHSALFTLQVFARPDGEASAARVGFTVTRKVGGAVERNRIKRRLRETVRTALDLNLKATHDYVIVARRGVLDAPFPAIAAGLAAALIKVQSTRGTPKLAKGGSAIDRGPPSQRRGPPQQPDE